MTRFKHISPKCLLKENSVFLYVCKVSETLMPRLGLTHSMSYINLFISKFLLPISQLLHTLVQKHYPLSINDDNIKSILTYCII